MEDSTNITESQEPAVQQNNQGTKTFTQEEVNRIVQERLARAKTVQNPDPKERELEQRENALYVREQMAEHGLPKELMEDFKGMDKATIDKCIKIIVPYANIAKEPFLNPVGPTNGGYSENKESVAIRAAMGLKR